MPMIDIEEEQLPAIDWNRHSIGFGPALKDATQQKSLGTVAFTVDEMQVLRVLLSQPIGGERPIDVYPNLMTFSQLITAMQAWSKQRGGP